MCIKAILFDINGTLIHIITDEHSYLIYNEISKFLIYSNIRISPESLKEFYFTALKAQLQNGEAHPEFNAVEIFRKLLENHHIYDVHMATMLANLFRSLSLKQLILYPGAAELLQTLSQEFIIGAVTDAQTTYALAEMNYTGISCFFSSIIISGKDRYRKPDIRMFLEASQTLNVNPYECIFIGNDAYTDILGAQKAGMKTIMFHSGQGCQYIEGVKADYETTSLKEIYEGIRYIAGR